jgi:NADH dehydrogenase [ubiquinone] 1 alpha subcomplex assembly factor 7
LGPGRGTLMKDVVRATAKVPGLHDAAAVHLVETSPVLRALQRGNLGNATWHETVVTLPGQPSIIIANEFFDALPVKQYVERNGRVSERCVETDSDGLAIGERESDIASLGKDGVFEVSPVRLDVALLLGRLIATHGGAALVIDYGHKKSAIGDSLQAMTGHQYCGILDTPGEADITSHVDFEQLGVAFAAAKTTVHGVLMQGEFLDAMGLSIRAEALSRNMKGPDVETFRRGIKRLADDTEMGQLFKVMAVTGPGQPVPYPFGVP